LLDFENPIIEFQGYVKEGNNEIPFKMAGGLSVFTEGLWNTVPPQTNKNVSPHDP